MLAAQPKTDTDPDYGRADKAAAWLLLSRLYLNAGTYLNNDGQNNPYWDKALEYVNPAKRKATPIKNEKRFSEQKRKAMKIIKAILEIVSPLLLH